MAANPLRLAGRAVAAALFAFSLCAGAAQAAELGGRPFEDPSQVIPMPKDWVEKSVAHKTPQPVDLAVSLDQQLYPALLPLIGEFRRDRNLKIATQKGTCGISSGALAEKAVDMAGYCCPPAVTDRLPGLKFHTLGIGSIALIVHPDNPLDDITLDEARAMFAGKVRRWSDLPMSGIKDSSKSPTRSIVRLHCKLRPGHWRLILDNEDSFGSAVQEVGAITDMVLQVARNPAAIGYETLWHVTRHADQGKVKILKIDGVDPRDRKALAEGKYPFYRVFNITTWTDAPASNKFSDELAAYLLQRAADIEERFAIVPHTELGKNGWKIQDGELVSEPRT